MEVPVRKWIKVFNAVYNKIVFWQLHVTVFYTRKLVFDMMIKLSII